jgi:CTP synthase
MVAELKRQKPSIKVGLVGKYVELHDAYLSVREALNHAALYYGVDIDFHWISSTDIEKNNGKDLLAGLDAIIVPGGFGSRGVEGKIAAAHYARENQIPYLGLCLGLQVMMIEFARNVLGLKEADSAEFDKLTPDPVIDLMLEQRGLDQMGGTMRLGLYPCHIKPDTKASALYQAEVIQERHRHRYEFNNEYRQRFEENGVVFSGMSPDGILVEMAELKDHPFMMACQFHPEFLSRPNRAHPLFLGFIESACKKAGFSDQLVNLDFTN